VGCCRAIHPSKGRVAKPSGTLLTFRPPSVYCSFNYRRRRVHEESVGHRRLPGRLSSRRARPRSLPGNCQDKIPVHHPCHTFTFSASPHAAHTCWDPLPRANKIEPEPRAARRATFDLDIRLRRPHSVAQMLCISKQVHGTPHISRLPTRCEGGICYSLPFARRQTSLTTVVSSMVEVEQGKCSNISCVLIHPPHSGDMANLQLDSTRSPTAFHLI
jgi:hypothetical protein